MKSKSVVVAALFSCALLAFAQESPYERTDRAELDRLQSLATNVLRLRMERVVYRGAAGNVMGLRSEDTLVSERLDSRTYFAVDRRFGTGKAAGVFDGPEKEQLGMAEELLRGLSIPAKEIDEQKILKEMTQVGHVDREKNKLITEEARPGKHFVRISRHIEGVPVFSSHAVVGFTKDQQVGFLEVHWPEIPRAAIEEAHRLQSLVREGWRPPEQKYAKVRSVQVGIIHSPAIGFVMDVYPAIQVVYDSADGKMGQKEVLYLNRDSKPVPVPREFDNPLKPSEEKCIEPKRSQPSDEKPEAPKK
jgi:hypothetical protein